MRDKFWAVWRETGGSPPAKKHETKQEAITEAQRLVRQTGGKYHILEVIGYAERMDLPVKYTKLI